MKTELLLKFKYSWKHTSYCPLMHQFEVQKPTASNSKCRKRLLTGWIYHIYLSFHFYRDQCLKCVSNQGTEYWHVQFLSHCILLLITPYSHFPINVDTQALVSGSVGENEPAQRSCKRRRNCEVAVWGRT